MDLYYIGLYIRETVVFCCAKSKRQYLLTLQVTAVQSQKSVSAYFTSKQKLPF